LGKTVVNLLPYVLGVTGVNLIRCLIEATDRQIKKSG
jgi:hypothetical protein